MKCTSCVNDSLTVERLTFCIYGNVTSVKVISLQVVSGEANLYSLSDKYTQLIGKNLSEKYRNFIKHRHSAYYNYFIQRAFPNLILKGMPV